MADDTPARTSSDPGAPTAPTAAAVAPPWRTLRLYGHPVRFLTLALAIPWVLWLAAGALSHRADQGLGVRLATAALSLAGLVAPALVAWMMVRHHPALRADVLRRLVDVRSIPRWTILAAALLLPGALIVATAISVLAGGDPAQFLPRGGASFTAGLLPAWFVLIGAAVLEELAWHSYGTDALLARRSVLVASLGFGLYWAVWHLPLAGIRGYYQAEVVEQGWLTSANFIVSIFAFVLLLNWVYLRSGRSIGIAILFHAAANVGNEVLRTEPGTKAIQTGLLVLVCLVLLWHDRRLLLRSPRHDEAPR